MKFDLRQRTILLTVAGSRAYGIHLPTSDVDLKGVAIPSKEYFLASQDRFEQADKSEHIDQFRNLLTSEEHRAISGTKLEGSIYEIRKFIGLAADCNPNILDGLFCRDEEIRYITPLGQKLRDNRHLFVSAKAKHTFSGYAASQMKRIRGHRAWLLNPPSHQPTRAEYGLPENTLIPSDHLMAAQAAVAKQLAHWDFDFSGMNDAEIIHVTTQVSDYLTDVMVHLGYPNVEDAKWLAAARSVGLDNNLIYVMQKEREYEAASRYWKQYQEWKLKRNHDRAALEEKFGYDTKHAGHLFRLLRMCREILETGQINVWRGRGGPDDAEEIRAIRQGAWTYDQLDEWATKEDQALETLYRERKYVVPKQPDRDAIDRLCVELVEAALARDRFQ